MAYDYGKEPWDKQDKEYLKKLITKVIESHDGKTPVNQLSNEDLEKFPGTNIQGQAIRKPESQESTMALYIINPDQKLSKRFTVTHTMVSFLLRKTQRITYGTSDPEGHQTKIILQWEKEVRR